MELKDLRNREYFNWFNENYYLSVYDINDNFITNIDDIKNATTLFNIENKELLNKLRNNENFVYNGHIVKVYIYKKFKIQECYRRCMR